MWGIFKKIGQGLKKGFDWVKDKIIKPVAKFLSPVSKPLAGIAKTLLPGAAPVVDLVEGGIEKLSGSGDGGPPPAHNEMLVGHDGHGIRHPVDDGDWAKAFDKSRTLNSEISEQK